MPVTIPNTTGKVEHTFESEKAFEILDGLNPAQRQAVEHHEGPLLVIAGAGTGKTRVITSRIAHLVLSGRAQPSEIVALTFTDKAAGEMVERVDQLLPLGYEEIQISTFHKFCEEIVRESALEMGLDSDFTILSQAEQWLLLKQHIFNFPLQYYRPLGNPLRFINALISHMSRVKDELVTPQQYLKQACSQLQTEKIVESSHSLSDESTAAVVTFIGQVGEQVQAFTLEFPLAERSAEQEEALKMWEVASSYFQYQQLLLQQEPLAFDFGDVISWCYRLFRERPAILKKYQQRFKFLLIDEYQDTNFAQNELLKLLAGSQQNLMVVGDDDQSIYRFRGAAVSNILQFTEDFPLTKKVVLTDNYRSVQSILDASYQLVQYNNPDRLEVKAEINKRLRGHKGQGRDPIILHARTLEEETELIARTIVSMRGLWNEAGVGKQQHLKESTVESTELDQFLEEKEATEDSVFMAKTSVESGQLDLFGLASTEPSQAFPEQEEAGVSKSFETTPSSSSTKDDSIPDWSDFAILARANNHLEPIMEALRHYGIPFQIRGSRGLYVKDEIKDLIAYLRVLVDDQDDLSWFRLLSHDLLKIPTNEVLQLMRWAYREHYSLERALNQISMIDIEESAAEKMRELLELVRQERERVLHDDAGRVLHRWVKHLGLFRALTEEGTLENETKVLNIHRFFEQIKRYLASHEDKTVWGFVHFLDAMIEAGDNPATAEMEGEQDAVSLMTVHASKGLEFDHVFVSNLIKNRFPARRRSEAIPVPEVLIQESLPEGDEHVQEERRLFYVAMTRARQTLFLTYADNYGGKNQTKPSPFLLEALGDRPELKVAQEIDLLHRPTVIADSSEKGLEWKAYLPQQMSYSQFRTYDQCGLRYKYQYVLRMPVEETGSAHFGQLVHNALKQFYQELEVTDGIFSSNVDESEDQLERAEIGSWERLQQLYTRGWARRPYMSGQHAQEQFFQGEQMLADFYQREQDSLSPAAHLEKPFVWKQGNLSVTGYIDRIDRLADGSYEVIDYKTGSVKSEQDLAKKVKSDEQLMVYALACRDVLNLEVSKFTLYYLQPGWQASTDFSPAKLEVMEAKMVDWVTKIRQAEFEAKPSQFNCGMCPYRNICPVAKV